MKHQVAIRVVLEVVLVTACSCTSTTPCDDGVDLPPCVDCGPGAVLSGRFFCPDFPTSMMDDGQVVRQVGNDLEWLGGRFETTRSLPLDAGQLTAQIAFDPHGEVAAIDTPGASDHALSIKMFDPGGATTWRVDLGTVPFTTDGDVSLGTDHVFFARRDSRFDPDTGFTTTGTLSAYDRASGALAWTLPIEVGHVLSDPSGGVIVVGRFTGMLALGGTAPPLMTTSPQGARFLAAIDAAGAGQWAIQPDFLDSITVVTRDASGRIALGGLGSRTAASAVALLDASGRLLWVRTLADGDVPISLAIDGDTVIAGGTSLDVVTAASVQPIPVTATDTGHRAIVVLGVPSPDSILASVESFPTFNDDDNTQGPPPTLTFDSKVLHGSGTAIVELAR
jgi:PQQ-like domain